MKFLVGLVVFIVFWTVTLSLCFSSKIKKSIFCHVTFLGGHVMVPELRKYQIRIPRKILGRKEEWPYFCSSSKIKKINFLVT